MAPASWRCYHVYDCRKTDAAAQPCLGGKVATSRSSGRIPTINFISDKLPAASHSATESATSIVPLSISQKQVMSPSCFKLAKAKIIGRPPRKPTANRFTGFA